MDDNQGNVTNQFQGKRHTHAYLRDMRISILSSPWSIVTAPQSQLMPQRMWPGHPWKPFQIPCGKILSPLPSDLGIERLKYYQ